MTQKCLSDLIEVDICTFHNKSERKRKNALTSIEIKNPYSFSQSFQW